MPKPDVTEEAKRFIKRIEKCREETKSIPPLSELVKLFQGRELDTILTAQEAALIGSAVAGRSISTDYIKRMRLDGRLPGKQISERAYAYRLRDLLAVEYRKPYTKKPTGRKPKTKKTAKEPEIALKNA